jgi:transposase
MALGKHNSGKEQYWRGVVLRWQRSGLTVRAYCDQHGLSEPSFYVWRRTIAARDRQAATTATESVPAFVSVRVTPPPAMSALEIVVGAGRVIRVMPGFDAATLRNLLAVLEGPSC